MVITLSMLAICSHCILSICNIHFFPALVLRAGFAFGLLQFLFIAFLLLLQPLPVNGVSDRQADFDMSAEQELRQLQSQWPKDQPRSTTQQLEPRSMPPQLANTLEHIVGQLDILTQVGEYMRYYESVTKYYNPRGPKISHGPQHNN